MELTDKLYKRWSVLVFSGLITSLTLAIPEIGILGWLSLIPAAMILLSFGTDKKIGYPEIFSYGAAFFLPFYLVNTNWFLYMYPLDFIYGMSTGTALFIVLLAWLSVSFFQATIGGVMFTLAAIIFRSRLMTRLPALRPLAMGGVWCVYEWIETLGWWGMPNCSLALSQVKFPLLTQTASLFGSYFVTFLIVAVNFYLAYVLIAMRSEGEEKERGRVIKKMSLIAACILVGNCICGGILWFVNSPDANGETVKAAAIQANIPMNEHYTKSELKQIYGDMTKEAAEQGAEVVVWSETAFPYVVESVEGFASELAAETGVIIVTGIFTEGENGETYNSLACFTPDGGLQTDVYSKRHLVPFGEFVPLKSFIDTCLPALSELATLGSDMTAGDGVYVIDTGKEKIGAGVCYDAAYEDVTLNGVRDGAEYFCISSNDAWFDDSVFLTFHNSQLILRSVESGRYFVHSANTGKSAIINCRGEMLSELDAMEKGIAIEDISLRTHRTLYSYIGNSFLYLCMAASAVLIVYGTVSVVSESVKNKKRNDIV